MTWKHCLFIPLILLSACHRAPTIPNEPRFPDHLKAGIASNLRLPSEVYDALRPSKQIAMKAEKAPKKVRKFDINADQVDAQVFFMSLAKDTPYNIIVHPDVSGKISLQLKSVSVLEVLDTVRNMYGYDYTQAGNMLEILPATMQTRSFLINYLDLNRTGNSNITVSAGGSNGASSNTSDSSSSTDSTSSTSSSGSSGSSSVSSEINTSTTSNFWTELKATVEALIGTSGGRKVAVSPMAGLIVVEAMPNEIKKVEEYLHTAELSLNRQVILEAKILEIQLDDTFRRGIDWAAISGRLRLSQMGGDIFGAETSTGISPSDVMVGGVAPISSALNLTPGNNPLPEAGTRGTAFGGLFTLAMNYKNLATFVELLETQGKVQVLSSPRISTVNHQKALIKVGIDQTLITGISSVSTTSTGGAASTSPTINSGSFFSGISLDVVPHIGDDDFVTLYVHPSISSVSQTNSTVVVSGQNNTFPSTSTSVRESDSIIRAQDGQVVVIGGLMQDAVSEQRAGVPGLQNIPGFGKLFKQKRKETQKSELVILLRPMIVQNKSKEWNKALCDSIHNFESLE